MSVLTPEHMNYHMLHVNFVLFFLFLGCRALYPLALSYQPSKSIVVSNGYLLLQFNLSSPKFDVLQGTVWGRGPAEYSQNIFARTYNDPLGRSGLFLETETINRNGSHSVNSISSGQQSPAVTILVNTPELVVFNISNLFDDPEAPLVEITYTVSLGQTDSIVNISTEVTTLANNQSSLNNIISVRSVMWSTNGAIVSMFDRGVVQTMGRTSAFQFASRDSLLRFFALVEISENFQNVPPAALDLLLQQTNLNTTNASIVLSYGADLNSPYRSALQLSHFGAAFPFYDNWTNANWNNVSVGVPLPPPGTKFSQLFRIAANNFNFPSANLCGGGSSCIQQGEQQEEAEEDMSKMLPEVTTTFSSPEDILNMHLMATAVYGSSAGILWTYQLPGQIAVCLGSPIPTYYPLFNFFDPDTYTAISTMMYSADPYLWNQARLLLEHSASFQLPNGQIPHHFVNTTPTYFAISGANQTGPNTFWLLSAFQYVKASGDSVWLAKWITAIDSAISFLQNFYHDDVQMLLAPGSLWIDVFIRGNYTSDTNAIAVHLFQEAAEIFEFAGNSVRSAEFASLAQNISNGMNKYLWAGDHFLTQINPDGSTADFVDYDSNLLAGAFSQTTLDRVHQLLDRVDSGNCTHGSLADPRGTWVSEIYYGTTDTYNGNTGDSATAMGRIAWADAHSRRVADDLSGFLQLLHQPLRSNILEHTWLPERMNCASEWIRAWYYHEYPEVVAMMTRELYYGVNVDTNSVSIDPWAVDPSQPSWLFRINNFFVWLSTEKVQLSIPTLEDHWKTWSLTHLQPNAAYYIEDTAGNSQKASSDSEGVLTFDFLHSSSVITCTLTNTQ